MYLVQIPPPFISRVLSLHLLHHLLPEAADLGGALDGHVLCALVTAIINDKLSDRDVRAVLRIIPKCIIIAGCCLIVMRWTVIFKVTKEHHSSGGLTPPLPCLDIKTYVDVTP